MSRRAIRQNYQRLGPDECWPWLGRIGVGGYGVFGENNKNKKAHRAAYEDQVGPIPPGLDVLHRCDNPPCCNGAHLFPGTQQDNVADMVAKGRQATWVVYLQAKLDAEQVRQIRADPRSNREIARHYGLHHETVSRIKNHLRYRSVA